MKVEVAVTNLGAYNAGKLDCIWVELGVMPNEVLKEQITNRFGKNVEEFFLSDIRAPFAIHEHENFYDLNEKLLDLAMSFDSIDEDVFRTILEGFGCSFDETAELMRNDEYRVYTVTTLHEDTAMREIAEVKVEEGYLGVVPKHLEDYIDYGKVANNILTSCSFSPVSGKYKYVELTR